MTDAAGVVTESRYDELGRLRFTIFDDGTQVEKVYDDAGNLVRSIDQDGDVTSFEYDDAGRQRAVVDGEGRRTETRHDRAGRPVEVKGSDGGITMNTWSPGGLLLDTTTPEGVTTTYGYDARGMRSTVTDELGHVWSTTYDDLGRTLTQRDPRQQGTGPATINNAYDPYGRLDSTTDALGNTVRFGYDPAGQQTSVTDPRGKIWRYAYSPLGELSEQRDPLDRVRTITYDPGGRMESTTDARGVVVDYDYDPAGQVTDIVDRDGSGSVHYTYDDLGRRATMTDETGVTTWRYEPDSAVASVESPAGTVTYRYDDSGLRTSMVQPEGEVTYTYDSAGRLESVKDWEGRTSTSVFDSDGRIQEFTRSNGITTRWSYDDAGRMTGIQHLDGTVVVDRAEHALDADGNRVSLRTPGGLEKYTLNAIDQLTHVEYTDGTTTSYTYDEAGNRLTLKVGSEPAVNYGYDDASQVASVDGVSVRHDASGNVLEDPDGRYGWDWLNRMSVVETDDGTVEYSYDGDGNRVVESADGTTGGLLYDRYAPGGVAALIADRDAGYVHGPAGVLAEVGSATTYPLADGLGSVRSVTDGTGGLVGTRSYDVFGDVRADSGMVSRFGFSGAPQDGALVHMNARDLSTTTGRFMSVDPVHPGAPGSVGWNQYTYVANNPTTLTDPTGAMAMEYGIKLEGIAVPVAAAAAGLAFVIAQQFTNTTVPIGLRAPSIFHGPSSRPEPDDEPQPTPEPKPIPWPGPLFDPQPDPDGGNRPSCRSGDSPGWYVYETPQKVLVGGTVKERAVGATACIKEPITLDTSKRHTPDGYVPHIHDRGHLIANSLGGSNTNPGNIVPMFVNANTPVMRDFEMRRWPSSDPVRRCLQRTSRFRERSVGVEHSLRG